MNTDYYLERGSDHAVCEDFATAGMAGGLGFALVSDGCSSSKDVDFGSRVLVHAAKDNLLALLASGKSLDAIAFARATIDKAARVLGCFASLPETTLDGTLLLALVRPDSQAGRFRAQVCLWGDGAVIVRRKDRVQANLLRFAGNAPYYLSYALNAPRRQAYLARQGGRRELQHVTLDLSGRETLRQECREVSEDPLAPCEQKFELELGDSLALVSDGITQFFGEDNTSVPWEALAAKFVDFKRPAGVFVRRRMNFFQRENRAAGVRHLDDVSVAAVTLL